MLGPGRPRQKPEIYSVEPLTKAEVMSHTPRKVAGRVATFRDSHHRVARLFAFGMRPGEVAAASGYSLGRVSTLYADPAFQELIAVYRKEIDAGFIEQADEYYATVNSNRVIAARLLNDKLIESEPNDLTVSQLVAIHSDAADRTGYPKRSVAVNVNVDFAAKLDQAIKRSASVRQIESKAVPAPVQQPAIGGMGAAPELAGNPSQPASSEPLRRRA